MTLLSSLPQLGANSGVHIIIFDEIDAICKQRGSMAGSTGVHDTVVNQLLSKIDGVEQLNNILVIGRWGCLALSSGLGFAQLRCHGCCWSRCKGRCCCGWQILLLSAIS